MTDLINSIKMRLVGLKFQKSMEEIQMNCVIDRINSLTDFIEQEEKALEMIENETPLPNPQQ